MERQRISTPIACRTARRKGDAITDGLRVFDDDVRLGRRDRHRVVDAGRVLSWCGARVDRRDRVGAGAHRSSRIHASTGHDASGNPRLSRRALRDRIRAHHHWVAARGALVAWPLTKAVRAAGLGFVDRFLGSIFGLIRGVLLMVAFVFVAGLTPLPRMPWWQSAALVPPLVACVYALRPHLPAQIAGRLD